MGEDTMDKNNPMNQVVNLLPLMAGKESQSGLELTREEAATQLWSLVLKHRVTCQELAKTNYVDVASRLLETGTPEEQHSASGLLAVMAEDEEFGNLQLLFRTNTEARISGFIRRSLQLECPHDRSKITASQLLLAMTGRRQSVHRLAPLVPSILCLLSATTPIWINLKEAHESATKALLNMMHAAIDPAPMHAAQLLAPEGLPIILKVIVRGSVEAAAKAAGCLYNAVRHLEGNVDMLTAKCARELLIVALVAEPERRAYVIGTLAELASQDSAKEVIGKVGGCETITRVLKSVLNTSTRRAAALYSSQPFVALVVQYACMLASQLAYLDCNKQWLLQAGAAPLLVAALRSKNVVVHESCTNALWHMGLEPDGRAKLKAAAAPKFLSNAVPRTWIATDNDPNALPTCGRLQTRADVKKTEKSGQNKAKGIDGTYDPTWDTPADLE